MYYRYSVFWNLAPWIFLKIGTFTGVLLIGFWQGWEFPLSPFTLLLFALYSFAQIVTVSKSLMSLFKKSNYVQIALFFPCTSLKTKVSDLLFFTSKLPFHSQTFIFFVCFWHFLTVFHFIMPKSKSLPFAHYKRVTITLYKRAMGAIHSFSQVN